MIRVSECSKRWRAKRGLLRRGAGDPPPRAAGDQAAARPRPAARDRHAQHGRGHPG